MQPVLCKVQDKCEGRREMDVRTLELTAPKYWQPHRGFIRQQKNNRTPGAVQKYSAWALRLPY